MDHPKPSHIIPELKPDFDPTAELWDRLADDLANQGQPCMETLEILVSQACQVPVKEQAEKP